MIACRGKNTINTMPPHRTVLFVQLRDMQRVSNAALGLGSTQKLELHFLHGVYLDCSIYVQQAKIKKNLGLLLA